MFYENKKKLAILITNDKGQGVTHIIILVPKKFLLAEMNKLFLPGLTPDWELDNDNWSVG